MGCAPSKNTSTVHPTISSNDSIILPEQGELTLCYEIYYNYLVFMIFSVTYNRHLQNRTILVQGEFN